MSDDGVTIFAVKLLWDDGRLGTVVVLPTFLNNKAGMGILEQHAKLIQQIKSLCSSKIVVNFWNKNE